MASNLALQAVISLKDEFTKVMGKASDSVKKMQGDFEKFQKSSGEFGAAMSVVGGAGVLAIRSFIDAANEAERGQAQLNAVLKSTGGIAGVTAQQANDLASSLMQMSTVGDDAILTGENMLLTFTNIGSEVFPAATQTMLDMAVAMNNGVSPSAEELSAQAIQLGKALHDPTKGMTALSKVGVSFTEQQEKQIKVLQESGDIMGAQKIILDELAEEYGGSAAAAAQTFGGQMENLQNRFGEIGESLGKALIPILQIFGEQLGSLVTYLESLTPSQMEFIAQTIAIGTALATAVGAVGLFIAALNPVTLVVAAVIASFVYLSTQLNAAGMSWEEFGQSVKVTLMEWSMNVELACAKIQIEMMKLNPMNAAVVAEMEKIYNDSAKRMQSDLDREYGKLVEIGETKFKEQKTAVENQLAAQRDVVESLTGEAKDTALAKYESMKADAIQKFGELNTGTTAEVAKLRENIAAELESARTSANEKFAGMLADALKWGGGFIGNFISGVEAKIPGLKAAVNTMKSLLNSVHQSYNPELPAQTWGQHFVENYAQGMQQTAPQLATQTQNVKTILTDNFTGNKGVASSGSSSGGGGVVMNFGDIHIAKEVDGEAFIQRMKNAMTREMQLASVGSL